MIIDTHCHYDMMESPEDYINKVEKTGNIAIGMTNLPSHFDMGYEHIRKYKKVRLALGFHPQLAGEHKEELSLFARYLGRTSYVGEIGLDFSSEYISTRDIQISCLRYILEELRGKNKIISVHSIRAEKELLSLLQDYNIKNVIFHWYSGPLSLIPEIISEGYYFSINEAMTLSSSGRKIIDKIPIDKILTESDAPFNRKNNIKSALINIGLEERLIERNFRLMMQGIR
ncbi:MAG: TatD family hydrolase [Prevotella koreensis]|uniref:TatD family hydrolase n=1 Tax=Prevotella koreensis TaxID=2490854 RepID=UPI003FA02A65